jgi:hypothetical protein
MGDPISSGILGGMMFGGSGSGGKNGTPLPMPMQQGGPNIFQQYQQNLPSSMQGNAPVNDPSAILKAYTSNLPGIMNAAQNTNLQTSGSAALPQINPNQFTWNWGRYLQQGNKAT